MKFPKLACLSLLTASFALGQVIVDSADESSSYVVEGDQAGIEDPEYNITIAYQILEKPNAVISDFLEFETDDVATLNYTITNHEETNFTLHALGGVIFNYPGSEIAANISVGRIDPGVTVATNQTISVQQRVNFLDMASNDYYLSPRLQFSRHVEETEEPIVFRANISLLTIMKPTMSLFDPQFISVQLFIVLVLFAIGYIYTNVLPKNTKKKESKRAEPKKVDASWLPEQYKK